MVDTRCVVRDKTSRNQLIVTDQTVCINDTGRQDFLFYYSHREIRFSIVHDGGLDFVMPFQNTEIINLSTTPCSSFSLLLPSKSSLRPSEKQLSDGLSHFSANSNQAEASCWCGNGNAVLRHGRRVKSRVKARQGRSAAGKSMFPRLIARLRSE